MNLIKKTAFVLITGLILMLYSEFLFWARLRPEDSWANWALTWLLYSAAAYYLLFALVRFRVRNIWSLFLVGAMFGWLIEGVVVQTTYEDLPWSISFTGLSWHALISVLIGWYFMPKLLKRGGPIKIAKYSILFGLSYGLWGVWWGFLEPDAIASVAEFAGYGAGWLVTLAGCYWVYGRFSPNSFSPQRWEIFGLSLFFLVLAILTFAAVPAAPLILIPLLGLVFWGLRQNLKGESQPSLLEDYFEPIYLPELVVFVVCVWGTAVAVYALFALTNHFWPTGYFLYLITTPLGFIMFGASLIKLKSSRLKNDSPADSPLTSTTPG